MSSNTIDNHGSGSQYVAAGDGGQYNNPGNGPQYIITGDGTLNICHRRKMADFQESRQC